MRISDWSSDVCSSDLQRSRQTAREVEPGDRDCDRELQAAACLGAPAVGIEAQRRALETQAVDGNRAETSGERRSPVDVRQAARIAAVEATGESREAPVVTGGASWRASVGPYGSILVVAVAI